MNKACWFAIALGFGLTLAFPVVAQAPPPQPRALSAPAAAIPLDQQPTKEQIVKLFEVKRERERLQPQLDATLPINEKQFQGQLEDLALKLTHSGFLTHKQQMAVKKVSNNYWKSVRDAYSVDQMIDDLSVPYRHHLNRSDVDAMIVFYASPAGHHLANAPPDFRMSVQMMMKRLQEPHNALPDELTNDKEELTKQHYLAGSDVDSIHAFFSSPAGRHFLTAQAAIYSEYTPTFRKRLHERNKILLDETTMAMEELTRVLLAPAEDTLVQ